MILNHLWGFKFVPFDKYFHRTFEYMFSECVCMCILHNMFNGNSFRQKDAFSFPCKDETYFRNSYPHIPSLENLHFDMDISTQNSHGITININFRYTHNIPVP